MLTLKSWKDFWFTHFCGVFVFFIPILVFSILFSSGFVYLGEDTSSIFTMIARSQPYLVLYSILKIFGISLIICCALHFFSLSFKYKYKVIFGFVFFTCVILRITSLYPAVADKWFVVHHFVIVRKFVQNISMLPIDSTPRFLINWLPCILAVLVFLINFINYMKSLIKQARIVEKARNSIYVDELDVASKSFSIQGLSFLIFSWEWGSFNLLSGIVNSKRAL